MFVPEGVEYKELFRSIPRVRTAAGVAKYGKPIGTPIVGGLALDYITFDPSTFREDDNFIIVKGSESGKEYQLSWWEDAPGRTEWFVQSEDQFDSDDVLGTYTGKTEEEARGKALKAVSDFEASYTPGPAAKPKRGKTKKQNDIDALTADERGRYDEAIRLGADHEDAMDAAEELVKPLAVVPDASPQVKPPKSLLPASQKNGNAHSKVASLVRVATRAESQADHAQKMLDEGFWDDQPPEKVAEVRAEVVTLRAKADAAIEEMIQIAEGSGDATLMRKAKQARSIQAGRPTSKRDAKLIEADKRGLRAVPDAPADDPIKKAAAEAKAKGSLVWKKSPSKKPSAEFSGKAIRDAARKVPEPGRLYKRPGLSRGDVWVGRLSDGTLVACNDHRMMVNLTDNHVILQLNDGLSSHRSLLRETEDYLHDPRSLADMLGEVIQQTGDEHVEVFPTDGERASIHKADAAAKMYGAGSPQHLAAIKKFGVGTIPSTRRDLAAEIAQTVPEVAAQVTGPKKTTTGSGADPELTRLANDMYAAQETVDMAAEEFGKRSDQYADARVILSLAESAYQDYMDARTRRGVPIANALPSKEAVAKLSRSPLGRNLKGMTEDNGTGIRWKQIDDMKTGETQIEFVRADGERLIVTAKVENGKTYYSFARINPEGSWRTIIPVTSNWNRVFTSADTAARKVGVSDSTAQNRDRAAFDPNAPTGWQTRSNFKVNGRALAKADAQGGEVMSQIDDMDDAQIASVLKRLQNETEDWAREIRTVAQSILDERAGKRSHPQSPPKSPAASTPEPVVTSGTPLTDAQVEKMEDLLDDNDEKEWPRLFANPTTAALAQRYLDGGHAVDADEERAVKKALTAAQRATAPAAPKSKAESPAPVAAPAAKAPPKAPAQAAAPVQTGGLTPDPLSGTTPESVAATHADANAAAATLRLIDPTGDWEANMVASTRGVVVIERRVGTGDGPNGGNARVRIMKIPGHHPSGSKESWTVAITEYPTGNTAKPANHPSHGLFFTSPAEAYRSVHEWVKKASRPKGLGGNSPAPRPQDIEAVTLADNATEPRPYAVDAALSPADRNRQDVDQWLAWVDSHDTPIPFDDKTVSTAQHPEVRSAMSRYQRAHNVRMRAEEYAANVPTLTTPSATQNEFERRKRSVAEAAREEEAMRKQVYAALWASATADENSATGELTIGDDVMIGGMLLNVLSRAPIRVDGTTLDDPHWVFRRSATGRPEYYAVGRERRSKRYRIVSGPYDGATHLLPPE